MRANGRHLHYDMEYIMVSDNARGPFILKEFVCFMQHGKVRVNMGEKYSTPIHADYKYWTFPVLCDKIKKENIYSFPNLEETHSNGTVLINNVDVISMMLLEDLRLNRSTDLGLKIKDGKVWVCINGISLLRFKPESIEAYVRRFSYLLED